MAASSSAVLVRRPRSEDSPTSRPVRGARRTAQARPSTGILSHHDEEDARENTEEIGREKNRDKNHTVTSEQR